MDALSLLPPVVAIAVALYRREVVLALVAALATSEWLLHRDLWTTFLAVIDRPARVLTDLGNSRLMLFCLLIGALIAIVRESGGVSAFIHQLLRKGWVDSPRRAALMTWMVGVVIFVESNLSVLTSGVMARDLFDRFGLSRARLAYLIDSTCAPVSILLILNGWGAYVMALLASNGIDNGFQVLLQSLPYNFYAWLALFMALATAWTGKVFGPLKRHEEALQSESQGMAMQAPTRAIYFLLPLATLVLTVPLVMWWSGGGSLMKGSGSQAILTATVAALLVAWSLLRFSGRYRHKQLLEEAFSGMRELLPLVVILLLGISLGSSMRELGTGNYVASWVAPSVPHALLSPMLFAIAGIIAFTTGTSWGTFSILIPIAVPVAAAAGLPLPIALAAVLGGGVFGDHASPISDTTIVASLASGSDLLTHVKTQLPYAFFAAVVSMLLYAVVS